VIPVANRLVLKPFDSGIEVQGLKVSGITLNLHHKFQDSNKIIYQVDKNKRPQLQISQTLHYNSIIFFLISLHDIDSDM
jgi:hypothetical protein